MRIPAIAMLACTVAFPAVAEDWGGFYVGGSGFAAGGSTFRETWSSTPAAFAGVGMDFRAGYLFEAGPIALGVEALYAPLPLTGRLDFSNGGWWEFTIHHPLTVRGRVGLPADRFLPYAAAGATFADFTYNNTADGAATVSTVGLHLATGVEWAASENVVLGLEAATVLFPQSTFDHSGWITHATPTPLQLGLTARYRF